MKLSEGETPLMRKPLRPEEVNLKVRPEVVGKLVQLLMEQDKLKSSKPASPKIQ